MSNHGKNESSIERKLWAKVVKLKDASKADAMVELASFKMSKDLYAEAATILEEALDLYAANPGTSSNASMRIAYENIGIAYENTKRFSEAAQAYLKARELTESYDVKRYALATHNHARMLYKVGEYAQSAEFHREVISLYDPMEDDFGRGIDMYNIGN